MKSCSFESCGRKVWSKGLCGGHYQQSYLGKPLTPLGVRSAGGRVRPLMPNPEMPGTMLVPLTRGYFAIIDEADAAAVGARNWQVWFDRKHARTPYAQGNWRTEDGRNHPIRLHRFLWKLWGMPETPEIDHENLDGLDCRRLNLRAATFTQNLANRPARRNNRLGAKGVQKSRRRFVALIRVDGKVMTLGRFKTIEAASEAYRQAAVRYHGEFARG